MRLWSLHPSFLDAKGLVALWREALLAQHVLHGKTKGYRHHPQLQRFYECESPKEAIAAYLSEVHIEAERRGYNFDQKKIMQKFRPIIIKVTNEQMAFEFLHLKKKLRIRDQKHLLAVKNLTVKPHPLFYIVPGKIEIWERV
jgi:hypothetical protein